VGACYSRTNLSLLTILDHYSITLTILLEMQLNSLQMLRHKSIASTASATSMNLGLTGGVRKHHQLLNGKQSRDGFLIFEDDQDEDDNGPYRRKNQENILPSKQEFTLTFEIGPRTSPRQ
jgi:hypothetical protein